MEADDVEDEPLELEYVDLAGQDVDPLLRAIEKFMNSLPFVENFTVDQYVQMLRMMADPEQGNGSYRAEVDADALADLIEVLRDLGIAID